MNLDMSFFFFFVFLLSFLHDICYFLCFLFLRNIQE